MTTPTALTAYRHTLIDVAKRLDPDGSVAQIAEVLQQFSPAFQDAPYIESNSPAGNQVTVRSSLPAVAFVRINEGVTRTKSTTKQLVDSMGIVDAMSEVDVRMRNVVADFNGYRWGEDQSFLESIAQKIETTIFTGSELSDEKAFTGFKARFGTISTTLGNNGYQIVAGGGVGSDNESIWVVDWGERACHLIYPAGTVAGITHNDRGEQRVLDAASNPFFAAVSEFLITCGLSIKNIRHVCRIPNIDKTDLASATPPNLVNLLIDAVHKMAAPNGVQRVIYCSRNVAGCIEKQAVSKTNLALSMGEWAGQPTPTFRGFPIRETDALGADEALVS